MNNDNKTLDKNINNQINVDEVSVDNMSDIKDHIVQSKVNVDNKQSRNVNVFEKLSQKITFLTDISINIIVELGTVKIKIKDLLELRSQSILVLDKHSGESLNILVNGHIIAKGELVVVGDNYGIRITDILSNAKSMTNFS